MNQKHEGCILLLYLSISSRRLAPSLDDFHTISLFSLYSLIVGVSSAYNFISKDRQAVFAQIFGCAYSNPIFKPASLDATEYIDDPNNGLLLFCDRDNNSLGFGCRFSLFMSSSAPGFCAEAAACAASLALLRLS